MTGNFTANFTYPPGAETYNFLDTIIVAWTGNFSQATLYTWFANESVEDGLKVSQVYGVVPTETYPYSLQSYLGQYLSGKVYVWPVQIWFDLIWDENVPGHLGGQNGNRFFVTSSAGQATTYGLTATQVAGSTLYATTTTAMGNITSGAVPSPSTSTKIPGSGDGNSLSTVAKAGIGAGIGFVVLLICIKLFHFVQIRRKRSLLQRQLMLTEATDSQIPGKAGLHADHVEAPKVIIFQNHANDSQTATSHELSAGREATEHPTSMELQHLSFRV